MAGIFKAYDIRGIYGRDLDESKAEAIGRAFVSFLDGKRVVVGRDIREHSTPLAQALFRGITRQGADVYDLGLCSTPMSNFANGRLKADGGIMITASHNPAEWNGFKLAKAGAVPLSGASGIGDIETIVETGAFAPAPARPGRVIETPILADYSAAVRERFPRAFDLTAAADMANGMGIYESRALKGLLPLDPLFDIPDGTFPNHEANPLKTETLDAVRERVRRGGHDFGLAFDGDADRVGFVDETGEIVPMDLVTALIAMEILSQRKGVILYDLRSSRAVREAIEEAGGTPVMCRVGHAFIKTRMREENALFAGELSGHYYFRENYCAESTAMAILSVAGIVAKSGKSLSELVRPLRRYAATGEINRTVSDPEAAMRRVRERFADGNVFELDGLSVEYPDWWFNLRRSNTEPLLRLNLEAADPDTMQRMRDTLLELITE